MARIGLFPGSFKPYHAGHDAVIRLAAKENDEVLVLVSVTNRDTVSGQGMERVWKELIEPKLPANVKVVYGGSPVGNAFKVIGDADQAGSQDTFTIYSDPEDANRFETLPKYAPNLTANGQVKNRALDRTSTVDVSGSRMRQWFEAGDQEQFIAHVPRGIDGVRYWNILQATKLATPEPKGTKRKKPVGETLVREFVKLQLRKPPQA